MPEWEFSILRLRARLLGRHEEDRNTLANINFLVNIPRDGSRSMGLGRSVDSNLSFPGPFERGPSGKMVSL